jgi:predicted enzyme related to lactoylglutathione lyase
MNPVVHFEMPYENSDRTAKFYSSVFGWQAQKMDSTMGNYIVVTTTESGPDGRPKQPGAINGGFFSKSADKPAQFPSVVIAVDDIKAHVKKVADAGGKVLGEPVEIPGVGWYVSFLDTEGNRVSLLQPNPQM